MVAGGLALRPVARWHRPVLAGVAVAAAVVAVAQVIELLSTPWGQGLVASDVVKGYLPGAQRWLTTGTPYLPDQVAGPWRLDVHSFIHPPAALPLFALFTVLPLPLWWAVPIGATAAAVWRLRPAPWTWPVIALCLCWPRSTGSLVAGNSDLWAMAGVAAGAAWGWPAVLLAVKPTFAPLALVAVRRPSAWIAGALAAAAMLPLLPLWFDWLAVIDHAGLSAGYSLLNLPLVSIGAVAWLGRGDYRRPSGRS